MSVGVFGSRRTAREISTAWWLAIATIPAIVASGIWTIVVGTASPGADESDLIQGWSGVRRNIPGYLVAVVVPAAGIMLAFRAGRSGDQRARNTLIGTSLALLAGLASVTRDAAETVMTTRAATVSWALFGADVLFVGALCLILLSLVPAQQTEHHE